jgi:hypothetical protein
MPSLPCTRSSSGLSPGGVSTQGHFGGFHLIVKAYEWNGGGGGILALAFTGSDYSNWGREEMCGELKEPRSKEDKGPTWTGCLARQA